MSLIARFFEERSVPTVSVYLQDEMAESCPSPRMLLLQWPFGHPFGEPGKPGLQAMVLHRLLTRSVRGTEFGMMDRPDWPWRRTEVRLPEDWKRTLELES